MAEILDQSLDKESKRTGLPFWIFLLLLFASGIFSTILFRFFFIFFYFLNVNFPGRGILAFLLSCFIFAFSFVFIVFRNSKYMIPSGRIFLFGLLCSLLTIEMNALYLFLLGERQSVEDWIGLTLLGGGIAGSLNGLFLYLACRKL